MNPNHDPKNGQFAEGPGGAGADHQAIKGGVSQHKGRSAWSQAMDRRDARMAAAPSGSPQDRSKRAWAEREFRKETKADRPPPTKAEADQWKADLARARERLGRDPKTGR